MAVGLVAIPPGISNVVILWAKVTSAVSARSTTTRENKAKTVDRFMVFGHFCWRLNRSVKHFAMRQVLLGRRYAEKGRAFSLPRSLAECKKIFRIRKCFCRAGLKW